MTYSQEQDRQARVCELEALLVEREQEVIYFRRISEETGKKNLKQLTELSDMVFERNQIMAELARKIDELREALAKVRLLEGIIPICSYCKKIRDDTGYWNQVEQYVSKHTDAQFSHGICPTCLEREIEGIKRET